MDSNKVALKKGIFNFIVCFVGMFSIIGWLYFTPLLFGINSFILFSYAISGAIVFAANYLLANILVFLLNLIFG